MAPTPLPYVFLCAVFFRQLTEHFMLNALKWTPETVSSGWPWPGIGPLSWKDWGGAEWWLGQRGGFLPWEMGQSGTNVQSRVPRSWGEPKWSPEVRAKHTGLPGNGGLAVGRNRGLANCPSRSSYRTKFRPSPSTAGAAQWRSAGALATVGSVSPGCFQCSRLHLEPAAGSAAGCRIYFAEAQKVLSVHFAPATFSAVATASTRWRGSAAGPPSGRRASGSALFRTQPPRQTPRAPLGTPGSFLFCLSPLASCPISFSVARGLLAAPGSGRTARDHVEPREGACAPRRAWEPGPYLASSDLGPTRYHPTREFIWRGCWRKPPSIRTWAYPWPDPRQDHHLVGPAWVLNQIGV